MQPICLVDPNLRLTEGSDVYVAGWGKTLLGMFIYNQYCFVKFQFNVICIINKCLIWILLNSYHDSQELAVR